MIRSDIDDKTRKVLSKAIEINLIDIIDLYCLAAKYKENIDGLLADFIDIAWQEDYLNQKHNIIFNFINEIYTENN